jgi:hypothetical protein
MARGGARTGAGRKAGTVTTKTREIAAGALANGITPLEFLLSVLRTEPKKDATEREKMDLFAARFEAAKQAAPYMHPRLSSVTAHQTVAGSMAINMINEFPE